MASPARRNTLARPALAPAGRDEPPPIHAQPPAAASMGLGGADARSAAGGGHQDTGYTYDLDRALETMTRPDGITVDYTRDTAGRLDTVSFPGALVDYNYFPSASGPGITPGRLSQINGPYGVDLAFSYDGSLLTSQTWTGAVAGSVSFTYNNDFNRATETVQGNTSKTVRFGYDADELLTCASQTSCSPPSTDALVLTRSPANGLVTRLQMGQVREDWAYNQYGELASQVVTESSVEKVRFEYDTVSAPRDNLGRITEKTEVLCGGTPVTTQYGYDLQGRLEDVFEDGVNIEHFEYDANGNRVAYTTPSGTITGTYDDQDRLLSYGTLMFTYGANGELESKTDTATNETTLYEYDALGNLIRVTLPDLRVIEYEVDGRGRRVGKRIDGVLVKQWLYQDLVKPVAELDGSGNLVSEFVYGSRENSPDYVVLGTTIYRIVSDHLGSPRRIVNVDNPSDVLFEAEYSSFGEMTFVSGVAGVVPFGFAGGMYDADTGLTRFGARDLDSRTGRWTSKDPLRFAGAQGSFYVYAGADPINRRDPFGLQTNDCSYYEDRCRQTHEEYYCHLATTVCDWAPKGDPNEDPTKDEGPWLDWNQCVRECLQRCDEGRQIENDADYLVCGHPPDWFDRWVVTEIACHAVCMPACAVDPYP